MDDKVKKAIVDYMKTKKFLVIESNSVNKSSIASVLKMTAATKANVFFARNFVEAQELVKKLRPEIIFCASVIDGQSYKHLLKDHLAQWPNRLEGSFFLTGEKNTLDIMMNMTKGDIDTFIQVPFTVNSLQSKILEVIVPKLSPTPYRVEVERGKEAMLIDPDRALDHFNKAKKFSNKPTEAWLYEGIIYLKSKQLSQAKDCFFQGLEYDPGNIHCLSELFKVLTDEKEHAQAYKVGNIMLKNYPVDPALIPEFTHMSVANAEYEDVFIYHEAFQQVLNPDTIMKNHIAASLTIYGKKVIKDKYELNKSVDPEIYEKAMNTMELAADMCKGKPLIYTSVIDGLKMAKEMKMLRDVIDKAKKEFPNSIEIRVMEIVANDVTLTPADSLKNTIDIVRSGFKAPEFYKIIIQRAVELDLSSRLINSHLSEAIQEFPDHRDEFESLLAA